MGTKPEAELAAIKDRIRTLALDCFADSEIVDPYTAMIPVQHIEDLARLAGFSGMEGIDQYLQQND